MGRENEFLALVISPGATVPYTPGNLVGSVFVEAEEMLHRGLRFIINRSQGTLETDLTMIEGLFIESVESLLFEVEASGHGHCRRDNRHYFDRVLHNQ